MVITSSVIGLLIVASAYYFTKIAPLTEELSTKDEDTEESETTEEG
ncbi:hypothetical protein [[Eubacterium] cellulosolvens]